DDQIDPERHLEQNKESQTTTNDQEIEKEEMIEPLLFDAFKTTTDNKSIVVNESNYSCISCTRRFSTIIYSSN
ncbi:unnamed protein product, partial [Rotaria sp. Silwood1]